MAQLWFHTTATLDDKGRLSLPAAQRRVYEVDRVHSVVLFLVRGGVWALTPEAYQQTVAARFDQLGDPFAPASMDFAHGVLATAEEVDIDRSGRIRLPTALREAAGIDRDVRLFTVPGRLEIWDPARWEARFSEARDRALPSERPAPPPEAPVAEEAP